MKKEVIMLQQSGLRVELYYEDGHLSRTGLFLIQDRRTLLPRVSRPEVRAVQAYLSGNKDIFFQLKLDLSLFTEKERKVLQAMRKIPLGQTVSYKQLAEMAGRSRGARFAGNVCAKNPYPLLIPCHRVIKSNGTPGGYTGGLNIKKHLLSFENRKPTS